LSTVALRNTVFMHLACSGGTELTKAFAQTSLVSYDYRYQINNPIQDGFGYDEHGKLFVNDNSKTMKYAKARGPIHSNLSRLRKEDCLKPKCAVLRRPIDWYQTYWTTGNKRNWKGMDQSYLSGGGKENFNIWLENMIQHSVDRGLGGFYTQYATAFIDDPKLSNTTVLRHHHLAYDLHIFLELNNEDWRAAYLIKDQYTPQKKLLQINAVQLEKIIVLDKWIHSLID